MYVTVYIVWYLVGNDVRKTLMFILFHCMFDYQRAWSCLFLSKITVFNFIKVAKNNVNFLIWPVCCFKSKFSDLFAYLYPETFQKRMVRGKFSTFCIVGLKYLTLSVFGEVNPENSFGRKKLIDFVFIIFSNFQKYQYHCYTDGNTIVIFSIFHCFAFYFHLN